MNPKVDGMPCVENSHFRLFRPRLGFVWLPLAKIRYDSRGLPERISKTPIEFWSMVHSHCFRGAVRNLRNRSCRALPLGIGCAWQNQSGEPKQSTPMRSGEFDVHSVWRNFAGFYLARALLIYSRRK